MPQHPHAVQLKPFGATMNEAADTANRAPFRIVPVRTPEDIRVIVALFRAYAASLDVDLAYQDFEGEMAAMPGKYAPPAGELLLARTTEGSSIGCVGLRPLDVDGVCEMKRLYVSPQGRGRGLGRALVEAVVAIAEVSATARCASTPCPRWRKHRRSTAGSVSRRWRPIIRRPWPARCSCAARSRPDGRLNARAREACLSTGKDLSPGTGRNRPRAIQSMPPA